jgi:hypothetical protein
MTTTTGVKTGAQGDKGATGMKICHPSVCVGEAKPSSCVCPTTPKK